MAPTGAQSNAGQVAAGRGVWGGRGAVKEHDWQGENARPAGTERGHDERAEVYHG